MNVTPQDFPIPNVRNLCCLACTIILAVLMLCLATDAYQSSNWPVFLLCAAFFALANNTTFSLFHEAVHGVLNSDRHVNDTVGNVAAAMFPTSFTLQQCFHLGHHCRNRTDVELFDFYYPHESRWLKRFVIYAMPTGIYWLSAVFGSLLFLISPWLLKVKLFRNSSLMKYSSFDSMLSGVPDTAKVQRRIRRQILFTWTFQLTVILVFNIAWPAWLACYWLFGMAWGSLQYTNHAFSKRDIRNGAWNLRVSPITRFIFLNYHLHLAHHQYPFVPWLYLPKLVSQNDERPHFWSIFLKLMGGPYPATDAPPTPENELANTVYDGASLAPPRTKENQT